MTRKVTHHAFSELSVTPHVDSGKGTEQTTSVTKATAIIFTVIGIPSGH